MTGGTEQGSVPGSPEGPEPAAGAREKVRFIESMIHDERTLVRLRLALAVAVFALGIVLIVLGQWLDTTAPADNIKRVTALGGGFVSSLSSFPLTQLFAARRKVSGLVFLRDGWQRMGTGATAPDEAKHLEEIFYKLWGESLS
jgi:hypothetical protein